MADDDLWVRTPADVCAEAAPCRRCGSEQLLVTEYGPIHVVCRACGNSGPVADFDNAYQAVELWNEEQANG